jgi:transketolase
VPDFWKNFAKGERGGRNAVARVKRGVREIPGSGTPVELLVAAGIDAAHVVKAVKSLLG